MAYSFDPALRASTFVCDPLSRSGDWGDGGGEQTFLASLQRVPRELSTLLGEPLGDRLHWIPHHLAHAGSAFFPSGFDEAAVVVIDGIGEFATTLLAAGRGSAMSRSRR